jgi:uncharacterized protein
MGDEVKLIRREWEVRRPGAYTIRGDIRTPAEGNPSSAVVICHGFKGFRRWGFFPALARAAAAQGHAAITFDFTHNGVGDDGVDYSALDRFEQGTYTADIDEIGEVLRAVASGKLLDPAPDRVALLGHSRGGAEALIAAAEDGDVRALVTWGAISSVDRWQQEHIERWEAGQNVAILNARTGQEMPMGPVFWRDILGNRERLDVLAHATRLTIPWLIVHGEADETVPVTDARTLFSAAGENAELCLIEGGTHTFGAVHPYAGPTEELRTATRTTLDWLEQQLT